MFIRLCFPPNATDSCRTQHTDIYTITQFEYEENTREKLHLIERYTVLFSCQLFKTAYIRNHCHPIRNERSLRLTNQVSIVSSAQYYSSEFLCVWYSFCSIRTDWWLGRSIAWFDLNHLRPWSLGIFMLNHFYRFLICWPFMCASFLYSTAHLMKKTLDMVTGHWRTLKLST